METYVRGILPDNYLAKKHELMDKVMPLGYRFTQQGKEVLFNKTGRIESIINELMPICDSLGLDVDDLELREYRKNDDSLRSSFYQGEIER
ncbi:MAG TPA: hypothetical protein VHQ46_01330 [Desulfobacteria bacterium]|nr:hypothetical protein [Desulfobacteria bacterium]